MMFFSLYEKEKRDIVVATAIFYFKIKKTLNFRLGSFRLTKLSIKLTTTTLKTNYLEFLNIYNF